MSFIFADWRNSTEYPKWGASLHRFAWEFLRRNPKYQADWTDYLKICRRIVPGYDQRVGLGDKDFNKLEDHPDHLHFEPLRLDGESENEWLHRTEYKGTITSLPTWYARKWGLKHAIYDPHYPYDSNCFPVLFESAHSASFVTEQWKGFKVGGDVYALHPYQAMGFDLSLPVEAQIEAARKALLAKQKALTAKGIINPFPNKIPRKEWIMHLRLLDAEAAGVTPKEMAARLHPGEEDIYPDYSPSKKVRTALDQARKLRDSDYRIIPSLRPPKKK